MSRRSAFDAISPAFQHTRQQLWPFRWSQWWRLALLGVVTGEAGSSGPGCGWSWPSPPSSNEPWDPSSWLPDLSWLQAHFAEVIAIAVVVLLILCAITLVWTYLSSICRFILIDAVVSKRCDGIRVGWRKWRAIGRRYFVWQLLFQLGVTIVMAASVLIVLAIAWLAGWLDPEHPNTAAMIASLVVLVGVLFVAAVAAVVVYVLGKDFVAPIMALEGHGWREAWRGAWALVRAEKGAFVMYLVTKAVMSMVLGIAAAIVFVMALVPFILMGVIVGIAIGAARASWTPEVLIGLAVIGLAVFMIAIFFVVTPFAVLFPAYSVYFLASRYPPLDAWLGSTPEASSGAPTLAT